MVNQTAEFMTGRIIFCLYQFNYQVFYAQGGDSDYARITDFSWQYVFDHNGNFAGTAWDTIQIKGYLEDYDLRIGSEGPVGANDTGIYLTKNGQNDLIAVVENITVLDSSMFTELG